ncbi:polyisoprenoid-binding protein [Helicobacter muridarum]|uniref:Polyisoprenoid-binding protein n=1 Tax=Helicobacter muridarum TaxID=216 RepID=A0A099U101_9HELI|nr:YceI family protein [Helicobacter muridarum]TLD99281.1 polyisoprenoid-binding protein [Helicobacter muridarum]STQ86129.1 secreted protein [Helicobacter muridarum]
MSKIWLSAILAGMLSSNVFGAVYNIDKIHSSVDFSVSHMSVSKVNGSFSEFEGMVDINPKTKNLVNLEGWISIDKIDTRNSKRDEHLLGAEYLDASNFPKGMLKSTKIIKDKKGLKVEADLTLKGITKKVILTGQINGPVDNPKTKKETWGLSLEGKINRKDFGIAKDTSGITMGEQVTILINLELHAD